MFSGNYSNRRASVKTASTYWKAYANNNPSELEKLIPSAPNKLPFLKAAFIAHLKRSTSAVNGLTDHEEKLLKIIASGSFTTDEVMRHFLDAVHEYGTPDVVIKQLLNNLQLLLTS